MTELISTVILPKSAMRNAYFCNARKKFYAFRTFPRCFSDKEINDGSLEFACSVPFRNIKRQKQGILLNP